MDFIFLGELPNMENPEAIGIIKKLNSVPINKRKKVNELVNGFIDLVLQSD